MKFVIKGGKPLAGEVVINGMKNATTPILAATLLTEEPCIIDNIPRITDVEKMLEILKSLGSQIKWLDEHKARICNKDVSLASLNKAAVGAMRSSILLLGPILARFSEVTFPEPGGCIIGNRPIDTHLYALGKLGTNISRANGYWRLEAKRLKGTRIILPEFSVTATENTLMAASLAQGKTVIRLAAAEPHVQDLCHFLQKMGAKIKGLKAFKLQTMPYPGFPTDLQAPFGVLATQCTGSTLIQDPLFEGRMGYIQELVKMGANAIVADPHRVVITGPTPLYGREIRSFDLRAGATLIIAGLVAQGETTINEAEVVDRGYERIDEKLTALGASIKRID
jgi:UDP-N-acetylglucosamine enolpyruvyl transferase